MANKGDTLVCALEGCTEKFTILNEKEKHKRYCCTKHRVRAWFLRTYVKREEAGR